MNSAVDAARGSVRAQRDRRLPARLADDFVGLVGILRIFVADHRQSGIENAGTDGVDGHRPSTAFLRDLAHLEVALRNAYDAAIVANTAAGLPHWTTDPYRLFPRALARGPRRHPHRCQPRPARADRTGRA